MGNDSKLGLDGRKKFYTVQSDRTLHTSSHPISKRGVEIRERNITKGNNEIVWGSYYKSK
jgi:hypothetical protein